MKSQLKKLRNFALNKHGSKEKSFMDSFDPAVEPGEVTKGMQDVVDMQQQYEGLLRTAHNIASSAYDFSRSLQEMASYMVETFGQIGDGEIGNIFNMLGKVQYEISKLLDIYASHVSQTIIKPTENLLSELKNVEDMKGRYDEKRSLYNDLRTQKPKGKLKNGKGDALDQQLMFAKDEFESEAMILSSRLQSLKQGRPLSLLTQAARYHTAKMHLFSKGLASLNALEPVMNQLALEHNIDRTMSEGDVGSHVLVEGMDMDADVFENGDESESFASSPRLLQTDDFQRGGQALRKWESSSKSAPISPSVYHQSNVIGKVPELSLDRPVRTTVTTYVLPSPLSKTTALTTQSHTPSQGMWSHTVSKSEPYARDRSEASVLNNDNRVSNISYDMKGLHSVGDSSAEMQRDLLVPHVGGENKQVTKQNQDPGRQTEFTSDGRLNAYSESVQDGELSTFPQISSRYGHSGPLPAKPWASHKQVTANSSGLLPVPSYQVDHLYKSGPVSKSPISRAFVSPRISPSVSPPHLSPPRISELHKLPPPPPGSCAPPPKSASIIAHSAPLGNKNLEASLKPGSTSPLPRPPPGLVTRSLSIPSSASRSRKLEQANITFSEGQETSVGGPLSPTLNPILLPSIPSGSHVSIDDGLQIAKPMSKVQSAQ